MVAILRQYATDDRARRPRKSYSDRDKVVRIPRGTDPTSDNMAMLLAELLHATSITKERRDDGHYVDMPCAILQSAGGPKYAQIMLEAEELRYIDINPAYSTKLHFCKSYRLKAKYRTGETVEYRLKRARPGANDRIRIEDDDETGLRLADQLRNAVIPADVITNEWGNYAVNSIYRGEIYANRCDYRRFHSTWTALPKAVRTQILLSGSKVIETDVNCAQAICVGLLAAEHRQREQPRHGRANLYHMSILARNGWKLEKSVRKFLDLCEAGTLYEFLLDRAIAKGYRTRDFLYVPPARLANSPNGRWRTKSPQPITDRDLERGDLKGQFVYMVFCEVWKMLRMPLWPIFAAEFPSVAEYVQLAKSADYVLRSPSAAGTKITTRTAYKNLARDCQFLESSVMIDHVARYLSLRFPIITIHDSIISPEAYDGEVAAEIKRWWGEAGVTVSVKKT